MKNEPVAWINRKGEFMPEKVDSFDIPLYTHQIKTLSKEEIKKVWLSLPYDPDNAPYIFAEAILRKATQ